jgi:cytosine deaminase
VTPLFRPLPVDHWRILNARVPHCLLEGGTLPDSEGWSLVDIDIAEGTIAALSPAGEGAMGHLPLVDLGGRIVMPCFVDAHVHLDKGHIWSRMPNPNGTFAAALQSVGEDRARHWNAADLHRRMTFGLSCAYAHGTIAIRTHIDSIGPQTRISWPVFQALKTAWSGRIALSAVPLFPIDLALDDGHMRDIVWALDNFGSTLGAVTYPIATLNEALDRLFRLASERGYDLDFHVDETQDPAANTLRTIAETALAFRFQGRILAGHCCSLARQSADEASRTIERVAAAGIAVVSLPMCNTYLQDRAAGVTPRSRGVTALHELQAAGVAVMIASDNTRDPFYAYGDLDMLEVWREGTRLIHLDHPFAGWARAVTMTPAAALSRPELGRLLVGAGADLVIFDARDHTELFARPHSERTVLRAGRLLRAQPPDYRELESAGRPDHAS